MSEFAPSHVSGGVSGDDVDVDVGVNVDVDVDVGVGVELLMLGGQNILRILCTPNRGMTRCCMQRWVPGVLRTQK